MLEYDPSARIAALSIMEERASSQGSLEAPTVYAPEV